MPLLKGKANIGHNIEEMQKAGHPHRQAVAAALHTALDTGDNMSETGAKPTTAMTHAEMNEKNRSFWGGANGNVAPPLSAPVVSADRKPVPVWQGHGADAADEVDPTQSEPADNRSDNLLERGHGGMDARTMPAGKPLEQSGLTKKVKTELRHEKPNPGLAGKYAKASASRAFEENPSLREESKDGVISGYKAGKAAGEGLAEEGRVPGVDSEMNLSEASEGEPLGDVTE